MPHQPIVNAPDVLKPETLAKVSQMGRLAEQIADRWASGWPARVRKMEQEGTFLERLTIQVDQEREALARAQDWGHLARHELMELFDINPAP